MADDVARALGAGTADEIEIAGKKCKIKPIGARELTEIQRECVKQYRINYLQGLKDAEEFLPGGADYVAEKANETADWTVDDLPKKEVFDIAGVPITKSLREWLEEHVGLEGDRSDLYVKNVLAAVLDSELLTSEECEDLTSKKPRKVRTGYVNWWVSGTIEGMVTFVHMCFKDFGVSKDDILDEAAKSQARLMQLQREIEKVTSPEVGNG